MIGKYLLIACIGLRVILKGALGSSNENTTNNNSSI
jgi:hypothetical protein